MMFRITDTKDLDKVANVTLYSISDTTMHIIFDHSVHIYGSRDPFYDVEA